MNAGNDKDVSTSIGEVQSHPYLLDTSALFTFIEDEPGANRVEQALNQVTTLLPWIVLLETYYITFPTGSSGLRDILEQEPLQSAMERKTGKNKYSRPRGLPFRNAKDNLRITSEAIEDILPVSSLWFSYYSK